MTVDEFTKIMLVAAISFAIVLIAVGLFKVLNNFANIVSDLRKVVKNVISISDMSAEDYSNIRKSAYKLTKNIKGIYENIFEPLNFIKSIIKFVEKLRNADSTESET